MAVNSDVDASNMHDVEFQLGNTATPITARYCIPLEQVKEIVKEFMHSGHASCDFEWEEI
jgi:hypothetical protein